MAGDHRRLPAELVEERRSDLSARHPGERFLRRMLDFEPPVPAEPQVDLDLPDDFVALGFGEEADRSGIAAAAAERLTDGGSIVVLNPIGDRDDGSIVIRGGRDVELAVLARARGFAGSWGPEAVVAALLGRPAVAFDAGGAAPDERRVAAAFLPALRVVGADEQALDALDVLHPPAAHLAAR